MSMEEMWNMRASSAHPNQLNVDMAKEACVRQEPTDRLRSGLLAMVSESQQHLPRSSPFAARSQEYGGWPMQSPFIPPQADRSAKGQARSFRSHDSFPVNGLEGSWHSPSSQWQRQQRGAPNMLMNQAQSGGLRVYCINYSGVPVVGQLGLSDAGRLGVACACHGQHMSVANFTQHSGLNAANPGEVVHMEGGETLVQWRKSFFSQFGVKVPEDSVGWEWLDLAGKYATQILQKEENACGPMNVGKRYRGASMTSEVLGSSMSGQLCTHEGLSRRTSCSSGHHHFLNDGGQRYSLAGAEQVSRGQESYDNASSFQPGASSVEHPKSFLFQQIMNRVWDGKLDHNAQQFNPPKVSATTDQCGLEGEHSPSQAGHKPESGVSEFHGKLGSNLSQMAATFETGTTLESLSAAALLHLSNKARQRLLETALQSAFSYRALGLQAPSSRVGAGNLDVYASFPEFLVRKQDPNHVGGLRTSFLQQQHSDVMVKAGLELKVHDAVISRMQILVDRESHEGRTMRGVDQEAITRVEAAPLTAEGDIMSCACLKCRKASPQAVPRLPLQACLNEKAAVEAAKNGEESGAHIEQPDAVAAVEMDGVKSRRPLACEAAEECEQGIPDSAGEAMIPEIDVCSNSSENVSSGLSDEGCDGGSGKVVDEGSGIGKCWSSDDVDVGVGRNDPSTVAGSPPSSSNMGKTRLVVKRRGKRASQSIEGEAGKLERKHRRSMKWKRLGPGADGRGSPASSFGQVAETQVTSEDARYALKRDSRVLSGEMVPPSKRRKLVKATNVTEENLDAANSDLKRKAGTLVIRVPLQKAKKGIRTKLWRSSLEEDGGDGPADHEAGKLMPPRPVGRPTKASSASGPSFVTKNTPLAGLSSRNSRMVSLSAILSQPVEARAVEAGRHQKLRDGVARLRTEGASVLELTEDEDVAVSRAVASAGVQTDRPKACPGFPQGERSARPVKRASVAGTYECQVSQVRSAAGSSISKEKLQQGFSFPMTKQVRSTKVKSMKQVHVKAGMGLLKRKPAELCNMTGVTSAKRPRVVLALKKAKEVVVCEVGESGELFKSSSRESTLKTKKVVEDPLKRVAEAGIKRLGPADKCKCDVCGTFSSASYNKLLCCCRCPVQVHQACYGVPKVPKSPWMCRTCKFKVSNPICVLCGYGGGAMTRVQKARPFCLALLQIWRDLSNKSTARRETCSDKNDNEVTLSSARMKSTKEGEVQCKVCRKPDQSPEPGSTSRGGLNNVHENWRRHNTVGAIVKDVGAKQWAHMVCTLWMPGTRCLNMGTMGMFDVSGVTASRRKALCSICQRKGGACIQCRVPKCSTPFHVWCAHEKGILQSEIVQDGSNQVGFFGKCQSHGMCSSSKAEEGMPCSSGGGVCARTEGYKGRLSLEERATAQQQMTLEGGTAVTPEQVAAWLRISNRKMTARRGVYKSANSGLKFDHREYLRFKQKKGWRKLAIYKSAIHALGLYTSDFIGEGEMVVEYVGEIVGLRVADKREAEYHTGKRLQHQGACYLFRIDADQIIDATHKGGIARFVNHSCSPNCVAKVICVDNLKKVIFFAKRHIHAGEEVTYDYKFNYDELDEKIPCFCGTAKCRGTLN